MRELKVGGFDVLGANLHYLVLKPPGAPCVMCRCTAPSKAYIEIHILTFIQAAVVCTRF